MIGELPVPAAELWEEYKNLCSKFKEMEDKGWNMLSSRNFPKLRKVSNKLFEIKIKLQRYNYRATRDFCNVPRLEKIK